MAWIVKLLPTPPSNPLAGALSRGNHPALRRHLSHQGRSAQRQTRGRTGRARRILRPTLTRPRLDAVRRVRHHDLVAQLGRTRRTPGPDGDGLLLVATESYLWGGLRLSATGHPVPCLSTRSKGGSSSTSDGYRGPSRASTPSRSTPTSTSPSPCLLACTTSG